MKETFYFQHDYGARNDPKMQKVLMRLGLSGIGLFWSLIEMLYENNGNLPLSECESIAFALRTDENALRSMINDFDLFKISDGKFYSESVLTRLNIRDEKSKKARESANYRWKPREKDANGLRTDCDGNAIKEKKEKEKKEKERKGKEIIKLVFPFESKIFIEKWNLWKKFRIEIKKPYKGIIEEQTALKRISELSKLDEIKAIAILEQSMANGWQGLFKLNNETNGRPGKVSVTERAADNLRAYAQEVYGRKDG